MPSPSPLASVVVVVVLLLMASHAKTAAAVGSAVPLQFVGRATARECKEENSQKGSMACF
jgi:hypothetical protein